MLTARLAALGWEIKEALRKQAWRTRHEIRGAEMDIGRRATTGIDGRTYFGLPLRDDTAFTHYTEPSLPGTRPGLRRHPPEEVS